MIGLNRGIYTEHQLKIVLQIEKHRPKNWNLCLLMYLTSIKS